MKIILAEGEIVVWLDDDSSIGNVFVNQWGKKKFNLISLMDFVEKKHWKKLRGKQVKLILEVQNDK